MESLPKIKSVCSQIEESKTDAVAPEIQGNSVELHRGFDSTLPQMWEQSQTHPTRRRDADSEQTSSTALSGIKWCLI